MDPRLLRIRRKVEQGERLSASELATLEGAAAQDSGSALKLTVAHALSNAEDDGAALGVLTRLRRDFPNQPQVELGYARALVGLERYAEAEQALANALALNPGDPEALKSLAAICLRRGELSRARTLVEEALRLDPVDGEAQALAGELQAVENAAPAPVEKALRPQFLEALLRALELRQVHVVRQGKSLFVKLPQGALGRLDVSLLHAAYLEEGAPLEETAAAMAEELAQASDLPRSRDALLARVRPVLRSAEFSTRAVGAVQREGPGGASVFYVLDDRDLVRYVPESLLQEAEVSMAELDEWAFRHLSDAPGEPRPVIVDRGEPRLSPDALGLWALCEGDGYDAARLLAPAQLRVLEGVVGPGPYRVALGRRELVLLCREGEARAREMLAGLVASPEGIPGEFRLTTEGRLEQLPTPR